MQRPGDARLADYPKAVPTVGQHCPLNRYAGLLRGRDLIATERTDLGTHTQRLPDRHPLVRPLTAPASDVS
jgi:hypothetical protein